MFKALFALVYYGLMRIGELTQGYHTLKAKDIHIGRNKNKILIVLHTSKTHDKSKDPQKIKISAVDEYQEQCKQRFFCPFKLARQYMSFRGGFYDDRESFFVSSDGSHVKPEHVRTVLFVFLQRLNLNPSLYNTHSFRGGRSIDLLHLGWSIDRIKVAERWFLSAVYCYLKM